jgi:serine/threonine protein kinase
VALLSAAAAFAFYRQRRRRDRDGDLHKRLLPDHATDRELVGTGDSCSGGSGGAELGGTARVVQMGFGALEQAAGGFAPHLIIGTGASCSVFKAHVSGRPAAIKLMNSDANLAAWEVAQFKAEMGLLCRVQHPNICKLLAFSTDGPQRCLVMELCAGGALDKRLQCADGQAPLQWDRRLCIAHDIARALAFLHTLSPPMLHRDLKTPNVLLDAAGNAKVADFGTVREGVQADSGDTHLCTKLVVGTKGYVSAPLATPAPALVYWHWRRVTHRTLALALTHPNHHPLCPNPPPLPPPPHRRRVGREPLQMPEEYLARGEVSEKLDAYSFGVVCLELLTGAPASHVLGGLFDDPGYFQNAQRYADAQAGAWPAAAVSALAAVAEGCVEFRARSRVTVREVLPKLEALAARAGPPTSSR